MTSKSVSKSDAIPFKIVMLGDSSVGKTCLVNRFIKNSYFEAEPTLAQDFKSKTLEVNENGKLQQVRLQIWDTAGSEQYRSLAPIYFKNAHAFCLVYDSTQQNAFETLHYWVGQIKDLVNTKYSIFLIAAKIDLSEQEKISIKEAGQFAKSCGAELFQTSAKDGTGVPELF